jgi:hypothetical protein
VNFVLSLARRAKALLDLVAEIAHRAGGAGASVIVTAGRPADRPQRADFAKEVLARWDRRQLHRDKI